MKNKHSSKRLERLFKLTDTLQERTLRTKYLLTKQGLSKGAELYKPRAIVKTVIVRG